MDANKIKELRAYTEACEVMGETAAPFALAEVFALLDEVEALTKDAERYRFIRDDRSRGDLDLCICIVDWTKVPTHYSIRTQERADAAIDAALAPKEKGNGPA